MTGPDKRDVMHVHREVQTRVVGKPDEFDKPPSTLGDVKTIDITIPPPKQ